MSASRRNGRRPCPAFGVAGLGFAALALGPAAAAQTLGGAEAMDISPLRVIAALLLAILVAIGAVLVLKRRQTGSWGLGRLLSASLPSRSPRSIRILETHRLGLHADLCRFTAANREYLVIVSANSAQVLSVSDAESAQPSTAEARARP